MEATTNFRLYLYSAYKKKVPRIRFIILVNIFKNSIFGVKAYRNQGERTASPREGNILWKFIKIIKH